MRPVGKQITAPRVVSPPLVVPGQRRAWAGWVVAALLVVALLGLGMWAITALRARELTAHEAQLRSTTQLAETEAERTRLASRVDNLAGELQSTQAEVAKQKETLRTLADENEALERDLSVANERVQQLTRGVQRRESYIDRLLGSAEETRALRDLLTTPGLTLARVEPHAPYAEARGHVLWHVARDTAVVYLFNLPPLASGFGYRLRITVGDGSVHEGDTFRPGPHGDITLPVKLPGDFGRLQGLEVVRVPDDEVIATIPAPSGR